MKIGFVVYGLDRPITGISRYALEMAKAFAQQSANVTLLVSGGLGPLADTPLDQQQLAMAQLAPALMTLGSLQIAIKAKKLQFDIIHDPNAITPFFFGTRGIQQVVSVHDVIPWSFPGYSSRFDSLIYKQWLPYALPKVGKIITPSTHSKSEIVKYMKLNANNVEVVPYGVDPVFQALSEETVEVYLKDNFQIDFPYLLYVGNLTLRKNVESCLKAFALIKDQFPEHRLLLVGPSTFRASNLEPLLDSLNIRERIIMTGPLSIELPYIYNGADVFLFPSLYEGFGLPPLEAMACGTPVVTSTTTSLPEVVGDAGLLVDPLNVEQLAEAIRTLLNDTTLRQELTAKGLARAKTFTWQAAVKRVMEIYSSLL